MQNIIGTKLKGSDMRVMGNKVYIDKVKNPGMLLIWADFCGHCHRFIPAYNEMVKDFDNSNVDYKCVSIESEEINKNKQVMETLQFRGYPSIYFFDQNGMIIGQYEGNRDKKSMLDSICKQYHHCIRHH